MTDRAVRNNLISGVGPSEGAKTTIIQYADDTIFFCEAKARQVANLRFIWQIFEWASGLRINRTKSELFYMGSRASQGERLAGIIDCKLGQFPLKYLGLPLLKGKIRKEDWWSIISKIEKRIEGWQAKLLSQGGRLTLVNAVLSNLPLYYFSVFKAPTWVIKRLDSLRRAFFWKGVSRISGGSCLVNWKVVCRGKKEGGLGVKDLEGMNTALLVKWWWRYFSTEMLPWRALLGGLYYCRRRPLLEGASFKPNSQWWRSVLGTRELFKCSTAHMVGDGGRTSFWSDIWVGASPLSTQFPVIYSWVRGKSCRIKECFGRNGWKWRKILAGVGHHNGCTDRSVNNLKEILAGRALNDQRDELLWRWTSSEVFSVKSMYCFLQDRGVVDNRFVQIWKLKIPAKVKIFIWLVLRRRVSTIDNLRTRGWSGAGLCGLCCNEEETVDHLFVKCEFVNVILAILRSNKQEVRVCEGVVKLWEVTKRKRGAVGRWELSTLAAAWWCIWRERNGRIFENCRRSAGALLDDIRRAREDWKAFCK